MPQYGAPTETMPRPLEDALEAMTQNWLSTIPEDIRLTHSEGNTAPAAQLPNRQLQNLGVLFYLRGNYIRCLIHRHHVLSTLAIAKDLTNATLVVDVAQDSIRLLVYLNASSDIYHRNQTVYNFFLINAVSILLLAVCHSPSHFALSCKQNFFAAVDLVRGFSRLSLQGRRLWTSLRGLVSRLKTLGITKDGSKLASKQKQQPIQSARTDMTSTSSHRTYPDVANIQHTYPVANLSDHGFETAYDATTPNSFTRMGDHLIGVFDIFGGGYMDTVDTTTRNLDATSFPSDGDLFPSNGSADDFSQYFRDML